MQSTVSRFLMIGALALLPAAAVADPGVLKFDEESFEVSEEAGVAVIRVERSQGEDGAASVQYSTGGGTATAGQDYTPASGTLTWAAGDGSDRTFTVPIANDSTAEGSETIQLTLSNATGAAVSSERGTSVLVILASDGGSGGNGGGGTGGNGGGGNGGGGNGDRAGTLKFDQREFLVLEESGRAIVTVERSQGEDGTVSVRYSTANGTATAGQDYTPVAGTLTWGPGDESNKSFTIPILDDGTKDGNETILLTLTNPTGGGAVSSERGTAVVRILEEGDEFDDDDDGDNDRGNDDDNTSRNGEVKFDERSFQVVEGQAFATVTVERSRGNRGAISVQVGTADLSAKAGEDYTATTTTLTWADGERQNKTVRIPILDDDLAEGNESLRLTLSNPTGGARLDDERGTATLTILDSNGSTSACVEDGDTACLSGDRFQVEVVWRLPDGTTGVGRMDSLSRDSAVVWFFQPTNAEMLVKVLDACQPFGNYWVFFAATTNVDFTVTVTDTRTGLVKEYRNPAGNEADPVQDTFTFSCS